MKTKTYFITFLFLLGSIQIQAQQTDEEKCFDKWRKQGEDLYNRHDYEKAKKAFNTIKVCYPDSNPPSDKTAYIQEWIKKCDNAIKSEREITVSLSLSNCSFDADGGRKDINVTTNAGSWSVVENPDWCIISTKSTAFTVICNSNSGTVQRSGKVTVRAGDKTATVNVTQSGSKVETTLNLSPKDDIVFDASGGKKDINVTTGADSWSIVENPDWCIISTGSTVFTVICNSNSGTVQRSGKVTVKAGDKTAAVNVTQSGSKVETILNISPDDDIVFDASGGSEDISVTTNDNSWNIADKPNWCTVGKNSASFNVKCDPNPNTTKREGWIQVKAGDKISYIKINQSGKKENIPDNESIQITEIQFAYKGKNDSVISDYKVTPTLYNDIAYLYFRIIYNNMALESKDITLGIKIFDAEGTLLRTSDPSPDYTYTDEIYTVGNKKQGDNSVLRGLGHSSGSTFAKEGTYLVEIWGANQKMFSVPFTITKRGETVSNSQNVTLPAQETRLSVDIHGVTFSYYGGTRDITVTTNAKFEFFGAPDWFHVTKSPSGVTVQCNSYNGLSSREESFYIIANDKTERIIVKQNGVPPSPASQRSSVTQKPSVKPFSVKNKHPHYGISVAYVQKHWTETDINTGIVNTYGWFDEQAMPGIQAGFRLDPYFAPRVFGLGLGLGIYYEYYSQNNMYDSYDVTIVEHSVYAPLHLIYRFDIGKNFGIYINAGIGVDYGLDAKLRMTNESSKIDLYDNADFGNLKRFNYSLEYGAGMQIWRFMLNFSVSQGLLNQSDDSAFKITQNKPVKAGFVFMF
ncbi:MAG: hypothetical protein LBR10_15915 [Prevotellaceae bacterium]|jgi:hypothetical protein|nr:hypothetical protein [Prevotellaceae bacterium]